MTDKKQLKVLRGSHYDQDTDTYYTAGETAELPASLLEKFPWAFEEVQASAQTAETTSSDQEVEADEEFDAAEFTDRTPWSTVAKDIKSGGYDDVLEQIADAERNGRDREKLKEVIESQREEADV